MQQAVERVDCRRSSCMASSPDKATIIEWCVAILAAVLVIVLAGWLWTLSQIAYPPEK